MTKIVDKGEKSLKDMQALAYELRGIAFHIENTDAPSYGNSGFENGKYKLLDDSGATQIHDIKTLRKIADLFEKFFTPISKLEASVTQP